LCDEGSGVPVELIDCGVAVSDEQHVGGIIGVLDVAVPGVDGLGDGVVGRGGEVDQSASVVHGYRPGDRAMAEFGQGGAFPHLVLSNVLG